MAQQEFVHGSNRSWKLDGQVIGYKGVPPFSDVDTDWVEVPYVPSVVAEAAYNEANKPPKPCNQVAYDALIAAGRSPEFAARHSGCP